jgi:hypothetical protein
VLLEAALVTAAHVDARAEIEEAIVDRQPPLDFFGNDTVGDIVGGAATIGSSVLAAPVAVGSAIVGGIGDLFSW